MFLVIFLFVIFCQLHLCNIIHFLARHSSLFPIQAPHLPYQPLLVLLSLCRCLCLCICLFICISVRLCLCKAHSKPLIPIPHSSAASALSAFIGSALTPTKPLGLTLFINWKGGRSDSIVSPDTTRSFMAKKYWKFVKLFTQIHLKHVLFIVAVLAAQIPPVLYNLTTWPTRHGKFVKRIHTSIYLHKKIIDF